MIHRMEVILSAGMIALLAGCDAGSTSDANAEESAVEAPGGGGEWAAVDAALGRSGVEQAGGIYRYGMPRFDLTVTTRGVSVLPSFALGSWLAFKRSESNEVVVVGDLVLTEEELNPVLARLQEGGIGQTAVHKHLPEMSPAIWWAHIHAHGDPVRVANTLHEALALTGTPPASAGGQSVPELDFDTAAIRRTLGHGGRSNAGVYSVSVPRAETVRAMGIEVPPSMGLATAINFQPTGDGLAAANGDFVMTADEVDPVISALRENEIEVVELHNHLTDEEPRLLFLHFWAQGDPIEIARGLRAALDRTNPASGS